MAYRYNGIIYTYILVHIFNITIHTTMHKWICIYTHIHSDIRYRYSVIDIEGYIYLNNEMKMNNYCYI